MSVEHLIPILLIDIAVIVGLSRVMGALFARINQPQVIGEMVAGIMLGPSLLGWISDAGMQAGWLPVHLSRELFPPAAIPILGVLSQIGVIFFLFLVGLELDPKLLRNKGKSAVFISHASIAVPFLLGAALAFFLYPRLFDASSPAMRFAAVALFMGAAMSITAFPVLARILTERNLHKTRIGAVVITCAAVDDVTAWCMLAFVVGVARAEGLGPAMITAGLSTVYVLGMFFIVRPFLARLQAVYDRQGRLNSGTMALVLGLVLISAWTTEKIGIHALFGAFLMGAVMPKGNQFVRTLTEKLEDFVVVLLLPIFFAYTGLKVQIGLIHGAEMWGYTLLIILTACVGKFGGSAIAARITGFGWREASVIGALMNTRGLMELVILNIGRELGVIPPAVFAMMVLMALVTTAMTSPVLFAIYPRRFYAAEIGAASDAATTGRRKRAGPSVLIPVADPQSGRPLLLLADLLTSQPPQPVAAIAADGAPAPEAVVSRQAQLGLEPTAGPSSKRRIYALHLRRPADLEMYQAVAGIEPERSAANRSRDSDASLQPLLEYAEQHDVPVEVISFFSRHIARDIVRTAADRDADLVLMGSHRPLVGSAVLGGTVHKVLRRSPTDVAILLHRGMSQVRRILVPYLGGSHDRLALEMASRLARTAGANVTVLHVVPDNRSGESQRDAAAAVDSAFSNQNPSQPSPVEFRVARDAEPVDAALREARGFDLVIVGMGEEWGLGSHLFRFRRERFAAECPCPLLLVRKAAREGVSTEQEVVQEPVIVAPANA
jgi:Kef-type K+ transport system membrane component KefB/nucleotide-binding universal stress UspA family protein